MLEPAHADLFKGAISEPKHVLADHRVLVGAGDPVQFGRADVARSGADRIGVVAAGTAVVLGPCQFSDDDIRASTAETSARVALGSERHRRKYDDGRAKEDP